MIKKQAYVAPNTKIRTAELEAIICQSPNGFHYLGAGTYEDEEINENGDY